MNAFHTILYNTTNYIILSPCSASLLALRCSLLRSSRLSSSPVVRESLPVRETPQEFDRPSDSPIRSSLSLFFDHPLPGVYILFLLLFTALSSFTSRLLPRPLVFNYYVIRSCCPSLSQKSCFMLTVSLDIYCICYSCLCSEFLCVTC
jgi:hypothetical protein